MKLWVLFLSLIGNFTLADECPKFEYRDDIHFGDRVLVTDGFYKGSKGLVVNRAYVLVRGCEHPSFYVRIQNPELGEVREHIAQSNLKKVGK